MNRKKVVGILGGMGPEATAHLFKRIIELTNADVDQDHIEIFLHNNTNIPDRTEAIIHGGASPVPEMIRSGKMLEAAGADFILVPCMTAYYFVDLVQNAIGVPILNAIDITTEVIAKIDLNISRVGILATTGTIQSNLFQSRLAARNMVPVVLEKKFQKEWVMAAIYGTHGIKAGYKDGTVKETLVAAGNRLVEKGAQCIIGGCTEIPLAVQQADFSVLFMDPMEALSKAAVKACMHCSKADDE